MLLYAELEPNSAKGRRAVHTIASVSSRGVLPAQAISEFLNVVRQRAPDALDEAMAQVADYRNVFAIIPTDADALLSTAAFARRYRLEFWDAVIWQACAKGGASILLNENLQDGFTAEGVTVVNPFVDTSWETVARRLGA
ncbi:MAG TPA: PIN domain-containing protein [Geminicoccaceae bacterium]|nr:PIN domain-containing protein [Geminicoccaceae bacterium]